MFVSNDMQEPNMEFNIQKTENLLEDLVEEEVSLPELLSSCGYKWKLETREMTTISYSSMQKASRAQTILKKMQQDVVPVLRRCLGERFSSFSQDVFQAVDWPCKLVQRRSTPRVGGFEEAGLPF